MTSEPRATAFTGPGSVALCAFDAPETDDDREVLVVMLEHPTRQLLPRQAQEKGARGPHVAERVDGQIAGAEHRVEELAAAGGSEPPVIAGGAVVRRQTAHRRHRGQQDAAGSKNPMDVGQRGGHVGDELQRLGENEAVEAVRRDLVGGAQIGDDGGARVGRIHIEHVASFDPGAELRGIALIVDLEHPAADIVPVIPDETLDVVPIDRSAPLEAPDRAQRLAPVGPPSHAGRANRRHRRRSASHENIAPPVRTAAWVKPPAARWHPENHRGLAPYRVPSRDLLADGQLACRPAPPVR